MALDHTGLPPDRVAPQDAPILQNKAHDDPSVFAAANMIREALRQKGLPAANVPAVCVLDPDGDLARHAQALGAAPCAGWACFHTQMYRLTHDGIEFGVIGNAVGAAFAVLLAEQAFASGCQLLISLTSAGQIIPFGPAPYFVLIVRALRDEGTSYHYAPPARYAEAAPALIDDVEAGAAAAGLTLHRGVSWTTDAPFRETAHAIAAAEAEGIHTVEMEAAALYAFAAARGRRVVCLAQVTNQMGQVDGDFDKGAGNGAPDALRLLVATARAALPTCGR